MPGGASAVELAGSAAAVSVSTGGAASVSAPAAGSAAGGAADVSGALAASAVSVSEALSVWPPHPASAASEKVAATSAEQSQGPRIAFLP